MESSHLYTRRFIGRGSVERRSWAAPDMQAFSLSTEEGIEGLGHDGRGARVAGSSDVSRAVAGPALYVGHWLGPGGVVENLTTPFSCPFHSTRGNCQEARLVAVHSRAFRLELTYLELRSLSSTQYKNKVLMVGRFG